MAARTSSRITGMVFVALGLGGTWWVWYSAHSDGSFSAKLSILGPLVVSLGSWLIIEAPELPARKLSLLGWVFLIVGLIAGALFMQLLKTGGLSFVG